MSRSNFVTWMAIWLLTYLMLKAAWNMLESLGLSLQVFLFVILAVFTLYTTNKVFKWIDSKYSSFKRRLNAQLQAVFYTLEEFFQFAFMLFAGAMLYKGYLYDPYQSVGCACVIIVLFLKGTYTERMSSTVRES